MVYYILPKGVFTTGVFKTGNDTNKQQQLQLLTAHFAM